MDCVEVCPVDCFYEGPNFLAINPEECIDCALCEPECPVNAIFSEDELPEKFKEYLRVINMNKNKLLRNSYKILSSFVIKIAIAI